MQKDFIYTLIRVKLPVPGSSGLERKIVFYDCVMQNKATETFWYRSR